MKTPPELPSEVLASATLCQKNFTRASAASIPGERSVSVPLVVPSEFDWPVSTKTLKWAAGADISENASRRRMRERIRFREFGELTSGMSKVDLRSDSVNSQRDPSGW